jgi:hypothetical protein
MPRLQKAISLAGSALVGGFSWLLPRRRLELVELSGDEGWPYAAMHGRKEVGRLAYAPGCDAGGDWFWAVKYGPHGYAPTRAAAIAALAAAWKESAPSSAGASGAWVVADDPWMKDHRVLLCRKVREMG